VVDAAAPVRSMAKKSGFDGEPADLLVLNYKKRKRTVLGAERPRRREIKGDVEREYECDNCGSCPSCAQEIRSGEFSTEDRKMDGFEIVQGMPLCSDDTIQGNRLARRVSKRYNHGKQQSLGGSAI
jgi:hypothetical protein